MEALQPQIDYHHLLEAESKIFEARETTLASITGKRISWAEKIDQLIDVINRGGDGDKYLVWLDGIKVDTKENARTNTFGKLEAQAFSGSAEISYVANFLDDIKASPFSVGFNGPAAPEGTVDPTKDEDLSPSEVISFPLELEVRSPEDRQADVLAAALAREQERAAEEASDDSNAGETSEPNAGEAGGPNAGETAQPNAGEAGGPDGGESTEPKAGETGGANAPAEGAEGAAPAPVEPAQPDESPSPEAGSDATGEPVEAPVPTPEQASDPKEGR